MPSPRLILGRHSRRGAARRAARLNVLRRSGYGGPRCGLLGILLTADEILMKKAQAYQRRNQHNTQTIPMPDAYLRTRLSEGASCAGQFTGDGSRL